MPIKIYCVEPSSKRKISEAPNLGGICRIWWDWKYWGGGTTDTMYYTYRGISFTIKYPKGKGLRLTLFKVFHTSIDIIVELCLLSGPSPANTLLFVWLHVYYNQAVFHTFLLKSDIQTLLYFLNVQPFSCKKCLFFSIWEEFTVVALRRCLWNFSTVSILSIDYSNF